MKNKYSIILVVFLVLSLLQSCGWRLRGAGTLPDTLQYAVISGAAEFSSVGLALKQQITSSGAKVLSKPDVDTIHFVVIKNKFTRRVSSVDSAGRVGEYDLSFSFSLRVLDAKGRLLVAEREVNLNRVYTYDVNNAIAKSDEEANIKLQMISFAVQQSMRRIGIKLRDIELPAASLDTDTGVDNKAVENSQSKENKTQ